MRNLMPILLMALAFGAVTCTKQTDSSTTTGGTAAADSTYVVFFEADRSLHRSCQMLIIIQKPPSELDKIRADKMEEVKDFYDSFDVKVEDYKIFVDVAVAFVATMSKETADSIKADTNESRVSANKP